MGLGDFLSGALGTKNKFKATPPVNAFQARGANLDETQYGDAANQARDAATGSLNAGAGAAGDQAEFANALKAQMAGNGPSLAQRQLETATQQNASQAAGALASAKGINPALAARMIGQNTANANQQAAGQSATTRLQEQLSTEGLLAQALAAQRGQDITQQGANAQTLQTVGGLQQGQNATRVQNTLGAEQINANVGEGNANRNLGAQQINAGVAAQNANTNAGIVGGLLGGAGAAMGMGKAHGGEIEDIDLSDAFARALIAARFSTAPHLAGGGDVYIPQVGIPDYSAPQYARAGDAMKGAISGMVPKSPGKSPPAGAGGDPNALPNSPLASNVPAAGIDSFSWAPPDFAAAAALAHGGAVDFRAGGKVPGRAHVKGDSPKNDTVPAVVSPGEIVLPRTVAQAPDAEDRAAEFVAAIKAKRKQPTGYGKVLAAQREIESRLGRLEKMADGGEVKDDDPGVLERVAAWWHANDADKTEAARQVDDKMVQKIPLRGLNDTRTKIRAHNSALDAAYQAAGGQ